LIFHNRLFLLPIFCEIKPEGFEININKRRLPFSQVSNCKKALPSQRDPGMNTPNSIVSIMEMRYKLLDYNKIKAGCDLEKSWTIRKKR